MKAVKNDFAIYAIDTLEIDQNVLEHHGILGQKWGVRRYQNKDGSLTPAGKKRYDRRESRLKEKDLNKKSKTESKAIRNQIRFNMSRGEKILASVIGSFGGIRTYANFKTTGLTPVPAYAATLATTLVTGVPFLNVPVSNAIRNADYRDKLVKSNR